MGDVILKGDPAVMVRIKRSARARRMSLRISRLNGGVTLTLPKWAPEREARDFALQKEDWIRAHLVQQPAAIPLQRGGVIAIEGKDRQIIATEGRRVILSADTLAVPGTDAQLTGKLKGFVKVLARERLAMASDRYSATLGRPYGRLTLRDTRSRWGSCTSEGNLMYSWRLIFAPAEVLDYVAAHEVAHLQEMHHGAAFWDLVEKLSPDYRRPRQWLRDHGHHLHRYRFGD